MKSAYLIAGGDEAKIAAARRRLRARAEQGGAAALQVVEPPQGRGAPPAEELIGAIPAMSLTTERRYLLADHVERWPESDQRAVADGRLGQH